MLIDKSLNKYLSKNIMNKKPSETEVIKTKENISYFKFPFTRKFSKFTENKLEKLTQQLTHSIWHLFFKLKITSHMI